MECRHLDGDRSNNILANLCWGTPAENGGDAARSGSHAGERNGRARLSEDDVRAIRASTDRSGAWLQRLARRYNICPTMASRIINRKAWRHVPMP